MQKIISAGQFEKSWGLKLHRFLLIPKKYGKYEIFLPTKARQFSVFAQFSSKTSQYI